MPSYRTIAAELAAAALSVCLTLTVAAAAQAQTLSIGGSESHFGSHELSDGFLPDPKEVSVVSGGSIVVRDLDLGIGCTGHVTSTPDVILNWDGSGFLRFFVDAEGDTTLVINGPTGGWYCDDDGGGSTNPQVDFSDASSGQYDVWIGSFSSDDQISGTLMITELTSVGSGGGGGGGSTGGSLSIGGSEAHFGVHALADGFLPDPEEISVVSGGSVSVQDLNIGSACRGYGTNTPDVILNWDGSGFLRFGVDGDGDTTLVINAPNGSWYCDDDGGDGVDPRIDFSDSSSGQYDIWIGSYSSDDQISGTLMITELSGNTAGSSANLSIGGDTAHFGVHSLAAGFLPDPNKISVVSGGSIAVSTLNLPIGCTGHVTATPDIIVNWDGSGYLRFFVDGEGDTTMVINGPNANWHCDDDSGEGVNPQIVFDDAATGQYDIWIGSYSSGEQVSGTLKITELRKD